MKRESYQAEMFNWCEALKDQIQKRGQLDQFEDQIDKMIEALEDDQTTEEDWYKQAAALYRDITESDDTSERRAYVPIGKHVLPKLAYCSFFLL